MLISNNSTASRELLDISIIYINLHDIIYRPHAFFGISISAVTSIKGNNMVTVNPKRKSMSIPINTHSLKIF